MRRDLIEKRGVRLIVSLMLLVLIVSACDINSKDNGYVKSDIDFDVLDPETITIKDIKENSISSINQMGIDVFRAMANQDMESNQLFSPTSLAFALAMLQNGGEEETKEGILKVLYEEKEGINSRYNVLMNYLSSLNSDDDKGLKLKLGNSLWIRDDIVTKQAFIDSLNEYYNAQVFQKDFGDRDTINQMNLWVEDQTNGMLTDTIKELDSEIVTLLMNTIYFKGRWIHEFSEYGTNKEAFYSSDTKSSFVDTMHTTRSLSYFEDKLCQMTSLPYYGGSSMVIILPKGDIEDCLSTMDSGTLEEISEYMATNQERIQLSLPKLDIEVNNNLNDVLIKAGMETAFSPMEANFKSMIEVEKENIYVSKIYQNTRIIVDEAGTEAAAVTVVKADTTSAMEPKEPIIFNCNKPYIYLIKDDESGSILFIGLVKEL